MSVIMMGHVYDADLGPVDKAVLLAYADHAAHDGENIYPSIGLVAWKTSFSERTVQRATQKLEETGILERCGVGPHGTNRWRLNISKLPKRPTWDEYRAGVSESHPVPEPGVTESHPGVSESQEGVTESHPIHHEPSLNHQNNSSAFGAEDAQPDATSSSTSSKSDDEEGPPVHFQGWLDVVRSSANRPAALRFMFTTLYPAADPPSFGRIGKAAREVGGAGRLAELMWQAASRPPTGDVISYLTMMSRSNNRGGSHASVTPKPIAATTDDAVLERQREAIRNHRQAAAMSSLP